MKLLILIVLAAGLAGAFWFFQDDLLPSGDEPVAVQPEPVAEDFPAQNEPLYPVAPLESSMSTDRVLVALPPLDDSDSYFLLALVDIFGPNIERLLVNEGLIDRIVATVDNLTRAHVAEKIRPVGRLSGSFIADPMGNDQQFTLSRDSYDRYDLLVGLVARADLDVIAATYRRFYPLFQESYVRLGYPDAYFNDRVVEVIDLLLATPAPDEPIRLVRPHVLYEFADPELETLASGQKLLIRMGGEHAVVIKQILRNLRPLLAQT